jgi:hypothetical protein
MTDEQTVLYDMQLSFSNFGQLHRPEIDNCISTFYSVFVSNAHIPLNNTSRGVEVRERQSFRHIYNIRRGSTFFFQDVLLLRILSVKDRNAIYRSEELDSLVPELIRSKRSTPRFSGRFSTHGTGKNLLPEKSLDEVATPHQCSAKTFTQNTHIKVDLGAISCLQLGHGVKQQRQKHHLLDRYKAPQIFHPRHLPIYITVRYFSNHKDNMKKEFSPLSIGHTGNDSTNARDWSPHRSTLDTKEAQWTIAHGTQDGLLFGEPNTISRQTLCFQQQQDLSFSSRSISMPYFQEGSTTEPQHAGIRRRCVSNDSSVPATENNTLNEHNILFAPMVRLVSLETIQTEDIPTDTESKASRYKRRRNSSATEDLCDDSRPMDEDGGACVTKPRKRRRLHERKQAMDSSDFDQILAQIGV